LELLCLGRGDRLRSGDELGQLAQVLGDSGAGFLGELFDLSSEHTEASADNFIDIFGEEAVRRFFAVLLRRFAPKPEPEQPVDPAFAKSLAEPRRQRKATRAMPQPSEPASA
jgi:hypothetical protein